MANFHQLIYALSDALDLVGVDDMYHGKRVAYMALECAKALRLSDDKQITLMHASLLHDCGVSSSKIHENLVFILDWEGAEDHCVRGYQLLNRSEKLKHLSKIILYHHTHWSDLKELNIDTETAMMANLIFLVDRVDALLAQHKTSSRNKSLITLTKTVQDEIKELSGTFFDPKLVDIFLQESEKEVFWFNLEEENLHRYFEQYVHMNKDEDVDLESLISISELFAIFVDAKSPYTSDHSIDVSKLSLFIAQKMNLDPETCQKIEIAGLLHDLGKLRLPDEILEKEAALSSDEFNEVKIHAYETYQILSKIEGLEDIALWAAQHHEKLNGKGYPYHTSKESISLPSRIIAVADVFQALAQKRPYRDSLKPLEILKIIQEKVQAGDLDKNVVTLVEENIQECWEIALAHSVHR